MLVDHDLLARLLGEIGEDHVLLVELLTTYLGELPGRLAAIEEAAAAGDPELLARAAHGLASPSSQLGIAGINLPCRAIQATVETGDLTTVDTTLEDLRAAADALPAELEPYFT